MRLKVFFCIMLITFLGRGVYASTSPVASFALNDLNVILEAGPNKQYGQVMDRIGEALSTLDKKQRQYKSQTDFAEYVYFFVHRKFLKNYVQFASLENTVVKGNYDCLTGTALYALFLSELDIDHVIVENNFHIYLLLYPGSEQEILLETTDPLYGFISDQTEVARLKEEYKAANAVSKAKVQLDINLDRKLSGSELLGLLFYNQSVKMINLGDVDAAIDYAGLSSKYYNGERIIKLLQWLNTEQLQASS